MIRKSKELPIEWDAYLMDEDDEVPFVPEAARFLGENCPEGCFLLRLRRRPVPGRSDVADYTFIYDRIPAIG